MNNHSYKEIEVEWMNSFLKRLTGAITRPLDRQRKLLVFSPGGSIHTFFMSYRINVFFLDQNFNILKECPSVSPWRLVNAPKGTQYVAESAANISLEDIKFAIKKLKG